MKKKEEVMWQRNFYSAQLHNYILHLTAFRRLFNLRNNAASHSNYTVKWLDDSEWWIWKNTEGSSPDLISVLFRNFPWELRKTMKIITSVGVQLWMRTGHPQLQVGSVTVWSNLFGVWEIKSRRKTQAGHVACIGELRYTILYLGKSQKKI
jgi:hypothetical protein